MTPGWREMFAVFARIGLLSFGGPAAQIAVMHRELVERRPLLSEKQYLNALSFCMLLPGPEAMQLATYAGWRLRGVPGGLLAGLLFVMPGALVMFGLVLAYALWGSIPLIETLFLGIKAAVVLVVINALIKLARKSLATPDRWVIAGLSFLAIYFFAVPFPAIIAIAAVYGALTIRTAEAETAPVIAKDTTLRTVAIWASLWWLPVGIAWLSGAQRLTEIGLFFSKLAVVTFGGAYAVLAYMTQQMVSDYGWITTAQMMDGLGLAETTPGPLILVTQFVGFLAGYGAAGIWAGFLAGLMALWVTFVPCFLWIFVGAPYIEWISARPRLAGAMSAITAAVVGVILNLSIWFSLHVFFDEVTQMDAGVLNFAAPVLSSYNIMAIGLALFCAILLLGLRLNLALILIISATASWALSFLT